MSCSHLSGLMSRRMWFHSPNGLGGVQRLAGRGVVRGLIKLIKPAATNMVRGLLVVFQLKLRPGLVGGPAVFSDMIHDAAVARPGDVVIEPQFKPAKRVGGRAMSPASLGALTTTIAPPWILPARTGCRPFLKLKPAIGAWVRRQRAGIQPSAFSSGVRVLIGASSAAETRATAVAMTRAAPRARMDFIGHECFPRDCASRQARHF